MIKVTIEKEMDVEEIEEDNSLSVEGKREAIINLICEDLPDFCNLATWTIEGLKDD